LAALSTPAHDLNHKPGSFVSGEHSLFNPRNWGACAPPISRTLPGYHALKPLFTLETGPWRRGIVVNNGRLRLTPP